MLDALRRGQPVVVWLGFFLFFATLARYWRAHLPYAELWAEAPRKPGSARGALILVGAILVAGGLAILFRASLFQTYRVLSGSMLPTMEPGAVLISSQSAYGLRPFVGATPTRMPRRGDVVVFHRPSDGVAPDELVKRVIGLPGDTISVSLGFVTINGWDLPTCEAGRYVYVQGDSMLDARLRVEFLDDQVYLVAQALRLPSPGFADYTVKPGEVFVLGDNRSTSVDSRAWNDGRGGGLPVSEIRGRVDRFLFEPGRNGEADPSTLFQRLGLQLSQDGIDFSATRASIERCLKDRPKNTHPPRVNDRRASL